MRSINGIELSPSGSDIPASPSRSSQSQESVTVVPSANPSPVFDGNFIQTIYDEKADAKDDLSRPVPGWPQVAKLISNTPDFEAFPAFTDLNLKSLLYYQAELTMLRKKLHAAEYTDARTLDHDGLKPSAYAKRFDKLYSSRLAKEPKWQKQWELIQQIRKILKAYNKALLQYSQVSALPRADDYNVETLRIWLRDVGDYPIEGPGDSTWGDMKPLPKKAKPLLKQFLLLLRSLVWSPKPDKSKVNLDLVVPRQGHQVDGLTLWVAKEFVPFYHNLKEACHRLTSKSARESLPLPNSSNGSNSTTNKPTTGGKRNEPPTLNTYSEDRMLRFTSSVATVIACLLPTLAIAILAKLHSTGVLLGVIAALTAVFAIGLMFLTDAGISRVEIFTATAAFSAVMVVFVQNQNQEPSQRN